MAGCEEPTVPGKLFGVMRAGETNQAQCALELSLNDGQTENHWTSDPALTPGQPHHFAVNIDGGPQVIAYISDGRFCDGGDDRQFGWGRFSPYLRHVNGAPQLRAAPCISGLRLYGRALLTCEAIGLDRSRKPC